LQQKFAPLLQQETGLRLDSWEGLIAGSDFGEVLIPFDAEHSLLIELATKLPATHPLRAYADALTPEDIDLMRRWIDEGARNDAGEVPYAGAEHLLYACSEGAARVSVIDMDANVVIRTVDLQALGFTENAKPHHTAVEPDGSFWYVSLIGDNKVLKFNRANELVGQADFERPGLLALHPTEDLLFVGRSMKAVNPPQRIGMIHRSDMSIEEIDTFFPRPHALAIHPDGKHVYTASLAENRMATVDFAEEAAELTNVEGSMMHTFVQFAVAPDGKTMVVGGEMTGKLLFFDTSTPTTPTLATTIDVNAAPWHPVFSPDGRFVYFANKRANTVTVVDVANRSVAAVIEGHGLSQPHGSAISPDGRRLYISSNNLSGDYAPRYDFGDNAHTGTVAVINTETRTVEKLLEVAPNATGLSTATVR
jgi:YVTN family beta-propeller protein